MRPVPSPKPVVWVGQARDELKALPREVQRTMGIAIWFAQLGGLHPLASPMKGKLAGVIEIGIDFDRRTFRLMYTAKLGAVIYALCAFPKKATKGIATPKAPFGPRRAATSAGPQDPRAGREVLMNKRAPDFERSSGNVFADLAFDHPEEELAKAQLIFQIVELIRARGLTQIQAAQLLGLPQPKVSLLCRGQSTGFSTDRLIRFLNRLDQDIEIVVRTKRSTRRPATVRVVRRGRNVRRPQRAIARAT